MNQVPQPPHVAGVEDVEELARVGLAVLHVGAKQVVVGTGVPLRRWGRRDGGRKGWGGDFGVIGRDNLEGKKINSFQCRD